MANPKQQVHVRWMIHRDMPEVLQIEQDGFEFPWSEADYRMVLGARHTVGMVADASDPNDRVAGFMVYQLRPMSIDLLNFAVAWAFRSRRVGEQMIQHLVKKLSDETRTHITCHIRERNLSGQLFLRSQGFKSRGIVRNFYDDTDEDAYSMEYALHRWAPEAVCSHGRSRKTRR